MMRTATRTLHYVRTSMSLTWQTGLRNGCAARGDSSTLADWRRVSDAAVVVVLVATGRSDRIEVAGGHRGSCMAMVYRWSPHGRTPRTTVMVPWRGGGFVGCHHRWCAES